MVRKDNYALLYYGIAVLASIMNGILDGTFLSELRIFNIIFSLMCGWNALKMNQKQCIAGYFNENFSKGWIRLLFFILNPIFAPLAGQGIAMSLPVFF
jgi:hypothetical protein